MILKDLKKVLLTSGTSIILSGLLLCQSTLPVMADTGMSDSMAIEEQDLNTTVDSPEEIPGDSDPADSVSDSYIESEDVSISDDFSDQTEIPVDGTETELEVTNEEVEALAEELSEDPLADGVFTILADCAGFSLKTWQASDGTYYLFLPGNVNLSETELLVKGIAVDKVSTGSYDIKTHILKDVFSTGNKSFTITDKDQKKYSVKVMQSQNSSILINLNDTDLDTINNGSKETKYPGNTVALIDAGGSVSVSENVEIKGRGNTTWNFGTKKPYQIKFDSKTSVFGMTKAKKWVLLANAFDDSMLRNMVAFDTARSLGMSNSPDYQYANLWIDGEYVGLYCVGEKVEIGNGRVPLSNEDGVLYELDSSYYNEEAYWKKTNGMYFAVKDSVSDDPTVINSAMEHLDQTLTGLFQYIDSSFDSEITLEELSKYVDLESMAQYYLLVDYLRCIDGYHTSAYFYQDGAGDVLHFGPAWDYDLSMGNFKDVGFASATGTHIERSILLKKLFSCSAFTSYVKKYYESHAGIYASLSSVAGSFYNQIQSDAAMNYTRWEYALGHTSNPGYGLNNAVSAFHSTYSGAASRLISWLNERYQKFKVYYNIGDIYHFGTNLYIRLNTAENYSDPKVALWTAAGSQDDLIWVNLSRTASGEYTCVVPVSRFKRSGEIYGHFYNGNTFITAANGNITSSSNAIPVYAKDTAGNEKTFEIRAKNCYSLGTVSVAVWSIQGGQDDIIWYPMTSKTSGIYIANVPVSRHKTVGTYKAHVYENYNGKMIFLGSTEFTVSGMTPATVSVEDIDQDHGTCKVRIKGMSCPSGVSTVKVPVWSQSNQSDIMWYTAVKQSDESWTCDISVANHKYNYGTYHVHCYGISGNSIQSFIGNTTVTFQRPKASITTKAGIGSVKLSAISLSYPASVKKVRIAVWSSEGGQDDIKWITASWNQAVGSAEITINPADFKHTGLFHAHIYAETTGGKMVYIDQTTFDVSNTCESVLVNKSADGIQYPITVSGIRTVPKLKSVKAAVWSAQGGQDDLVWYTLTQSGQSFNGTANMKKHNTLGSYFVHVYGVSENGTYIFLGNTTFTVETLVS